MSIRILYCLLLILLPISSIWAIPSDSSEVEKSIKSFLRFVEKNEKSTQKNYLFNYQQINDDNFRQELVNGGTTMFASGIAATHYNELRNYVDNFNNTYNIGNPASSPNSQFEIYIFRGRFFPSISTQIIAKREDGTQFVASNPNKLEDLKAKFSIDVDDNIIYDNLSNRVVSALKDQYPNKRILVVFAVEKNLFEYQNDDEYINDVETPNASKTTLGRSYALNIGWQSVGNVSEINAIGNLIVSGSRFDFSQKNSTCFEIREISDKGKVFSNKSNIKISEISSLCWGFCRTH